VIRASFTAITPRLCPLHPQTKEGRRCRRPLEAVAGSSRLFTSRNSLGCRSCSFDTRLPRLSTLSPARLPVHKYSRGTRRPIRLPDSTHPVLRGNQPYGCISRMTTKPWTPFGRAHIDRANLRPQRGSISHSMHGLPCDAIDEGQACQIEAVTPFLTHIEAWKATLPTTRAVRTAETPRSATSIPANC
jgi:hypothetical protein